ncbi:putative stage IV sporulation YqfD [Thermosinus carboxydivorans Nor1]|uniref:Putative stage IV sporulation YqfD n=1 Tax=Thermosinus carboxydivorans Nor1 TaxID=401526 RepID=A1HPD5_9FIRM|nr:sporulation protein YqfD [Thermosinus carboxydivorans]EAX48241.1 putative stage IV sporulation YqfD [Thermosinus carboxydivorans Nor1]
MTYKIANYLSGTVRVRIQGTMPEKFINLCLAQHIFLWGIATKNDEMFAFMRLSDFFCIRALARKSRVRVRVVSRYGWPFIADRFKRRKMLVVGAVLYLFLLNFLVSFIWFVDITGMKTLSSYRIKAIVNSNGLRPGVLKEKVDVKALENAILFALPEVAWVGIHVAGTRVVIEVVEKTLPRIEDKAPAHIVAAKDGVITEIIALAGQLAVKKGDTVKKGDLLIKGFAPDNTAPVIPGQTPIVSIPSQLIRAQGIVRARVWYEGYGEASTVQVVRQRTGKQDMAITVTIGSRHILLKRISEPPFENYETEEVHKKLVWWRNSELAVESTIKIYYELGTSWREITVEQARDDATSKAWHGVQRLIPENAQILSRNVETLKTEEPNLVRVKVSVETVEDIGQSVAIVR